ncbi:MAG: FkbM family methyltransferase [Deltaproteobacteria bacterium]
MAKARRPLLTKIIERIPQTVCLSSDIKLQLRHKRDNRKFWDIFTSSEYMSFVPHLVGLRLESVSVLDLGAGIGLFSLLIEHLRRIGVLGWGRVSYTLVEPSPVNFSELEGNMSRNLDSNSYRLIHALAGLKSGEARFFESAQKPYGSSLAAEKHKRGEVSEMNLKFADLTQSLGANPCFLKIDIEGGEFMFLESYSESLSEVSAVIIEWHAEFGDVAAGREILHRAGLRMAARHQDSEKPNRFTDLYLRGAA